MSDNQVQMAIFSDNELDDKEASGKTSDEEIGAEVAKKPEDHLFYIYVNLETARRIFIGNSFRVQFTDWERPLSYKHNNMIFITKKKLKDVSHDPDVLAIEIKLMPKLQADQHNGSCENGVRIPSKIVSKGGSMREGDLLECQLSDVGAFVYDAPFVCLNKIYFKSSEAQDSLEKPSEDLWEPREKYAIASKGDFVDEIDEIYSAKLFDEKTVVNTNAKYELNDIEKAIRYRKRYQAGQTLRFKRAGKHLNFERGDYKAIEERLFKEEDKGDSCEMQIKRLVVENLLESDYCSGTKQTNTDIFLGIHKKLKESFGDSSNGKSSIENDIEVLDEQFSGGSVVAKKRSYADIDSQSLKGLFVLEKTYENFEQLEKWFRGEREKRDQEQLSQSEQLGGKREKEGPSQPGQLKELEELEEIAFFYWGIFRGISSVPATGIKEDMILQFLVEKAATSKNENEFLCNINMSLEQFIDSYGIFAAEPDTVKDESQLLIEQKLIEQAQKAFVTKMGKVKKNCEEGYKFWNLLKSDHQLASEIASKISQVKL